jgi:hypothetical protein
MSARIKAYLDFIDWMKNKYPQILKNYHNNFNVPKNVDEGISVNNRFNISQEEFDMLDKIAHGYCETT